jgi:hypothetical protein
MFSSRGVAFALVGVSLAVFGIALSLLGLAMVIEGSTNINMYPFFGVFIALIGFVVSLVSAITTKDNHG